MEFLFPVLFIMRLAIYFLKKKNKMFDIGNTYFISNKLNKKKPINYLKLIKKYLLNKKIYVRK